MVQELAERILQESEGTRQQAIHLRQLFDDLTGLVGEPADMDQIEAPNAVLEVVDDATGRLVRRYLELGYEENDNGIRLTGEDLKGQEVHVVFLSNQALEKIHDLQGLGRDEPRCDHSEEESRLIPIEGPHESSTEV